MPISEEHLAELKKFFDKPVSQTGTKPLKNAIEVAIYIEGEGPVTLTKKDGVAIILAQAPTAPDMTFWVSMKALQELNEIQTQDVGDIGVGILKLMAHGDPGFKIKAKVHIGLFTLLRNGYLNVLPLGGPAVMKFLATKGFTGIGKIKEAISHLKD